MDNKELTGVMFPRKKEHDKQPDFKGSCLIGGETYYVAGWNREGKTTGAPYMHLQFQKKGEYKKESKPTYQQSVQQVAQAVGGSAELGSKETIVDEVPF